MLRDVAQGASRQSLVIVKDMLLSDRKYIFNIEMRFAYIAILSLLLVATLAQAVSNDADGSLITENSDEDIDLISEDSDDDSDLYDEEDEYDLSDLSEEEIAQLQEKFKWYGNYCGPGYCGGSHVQEQSGSCNYNVKPKDSADNCCLEHDRCCGSPSTRSVACNRNMLTCLSKKAKCGWNFVCHHQVLWMKAAFALKKNKVCGD